MFGGLTKRRSISPYAEIMFDSAKTYSARRNPIRRIDQKKVSLALRGNHVRLGKNLLWSDEFSGNEMHIRDL
jgi:hypothetical protein